MKKTVALAIMLCCIIVNGTAQKKDQNKSGLTKEEMATYEVEIKRMVNYLQETLNFIGYAFNIGAPIYIKQILIDIKGEIDRNTIIIGEFNSPLKSVDKNYRQKINKTT